MSLKILLYTATLTCMLTGCSYFNSVITQTHYSAQQIVAPTKRISKHMLNRDNFFVFGRIEHTTYMNHDAVAVVALSDQHRKDEVVDISHFTRVDSYYGLNLPAGEYCLLVVSDRDRDGYYDQSEIIGERSVVLSREQIPEKVLGDVNFDLRIPYADSHGTSFRIPVRKQAALKESFIYPRGTIRSLDDSIFSPAMSSLGMYEPAAFMEEAPMMFYALEEDTGYKVPVIFVHGINGSARDFAPIVAQLDRRIYKPWFFHYPSGFDLGQLSEMFYSIFLSGTVIPLGDTPLIIVAHSMGGPVVRDALSRCTGGEREAKPNLFITIASPMGGHPDAKAGTGAPVVIPSWRSIAPDSTFMSRLYRRELADSLEYHLIYAYGNPNTLKLGENSDGIVPLASQLDSRAQKEATSQYGFNESHEGILRNDDAIAQVIELIGNIKSLFPDDHLKILWQGGYNVSLSTEYSPLETYFIRTYGRYMDALASGSIAPFHPLQVQFLLVCRGEKQPENEFESSWSKFSKDFPNRSNLQ